MLHEVTWAQRLGGSPQKHVLGLLSLSRGPTCPSSAVRPTRQPLTTPVLPALH